MKNAFTISFLLFLFSQIAAAQFGPATTITNDETNWHHSYLSDIDGDGDLDIVASNRGKFNWSSTEYEINGKLAWFENLDGKGNFSSEKIIQTNTESILNMTVADFDNDNDIDIVGTVHSFNPTPGQFNNGTLFLFKNDGAGNFDQGTGIGSGTDFFKIQAKDIDNDNDEDIILLTDGSIVLLKNINNSGVFEPKVPIASIFFYETFFKLKDLDQDGDFDLVGVTGAGVQYITFWCENTDGLGTFSEKKIINESSIISSLNVADLDNDGWQDVITSSFGGDPDENLFWFKNLGAGEFESTSSIIGPGFNVNDAFLAFDIDNDGDIDFTNIHHVFFNDGLGNFHFDQPFPSAYPLASSLGDIDDDGDLDLMVSGSGGIIIVLKNYLNELSIKGKVFLDENENGQIDNNEITLKNQRVALDPNAITSWTNQNEEFQFAIFPGTYDLSCETSTHWNFTTDSDINIMVDSIHAVHNFGLIPSSLILDGTTTITSAPTRCGFTVPFWLEYQNTGTTFADGTVSIEFDDLVIFKNADPVPDMINGNELIWNINNLPPTYSGKIKLQFEMPGVDYLGAFIAMNSTLNISDQDGNTAEENYEYTSQINCAYDPNDKLVKPDYPGDLNYTLFGEKLEYTVRFQNTGTDTAFNIKIEDQLDPNLDWSTFNPLSSSHSFSSSLNETGHVIFSFENILLPDSVTNEPQSHGFVKYEIHPISNLPENTIIENTASIFFDFNPPIITNTIENILVSKLPKDLNTNKSELHLEIFPNPSNDFFEIKNKNAFNDSYQIQLFDFQGKVFLTLESYIPINETLQINTTPFPNGIYVLKLKSEKGSLIEKIVIQN